MSNQYFYRKHINHVSKIAPIVLVVLVLLMWVAMLLGPTTIRPSFVVLSLVILIEAGVLWRVVGGLATTNVIVSDDALTYTDRKGSTTIAYEDITKLEFPSVKYTGGWVKIVTPYKTIRLTVVMEGIHRLVLELKSQLDRRELQDKYNDEKLFSFLKTAAYSDHSWGRVYRNWKVYVGAMLLLVATGVMAGIVLAMTRSVWAVALLVLPMVSLVSPEVLHARKISRNSKPEDYTISEPDLKYEKMLNKYSLLGGSASFVITLVVLVMAILAR